MSRGDKKIADAIKFPDGYYMRSYNNKSDGENWCKCCNGGGFDIEATDSGIFENKMLGDKYINPDNIFFLIAPNGDIAGTITYRYTENDENTGIIHMVAIEKSYQGKGLAYPMNLYAVQKALDDGKKKIILTTDDWRIPAIKAYLRAGFCPVIKPGDKDMENRWSEVMKKTENKI